MARSKRIKDQGSLAKRVATSLSNIINQFDYSNPAITTLPKLNNAERTTLLKAVNILKRIGSEKNKVVKEEKTKEIKRDALIAKRTTEAANIIAGWEIQKTILDKVSFVLTINSSYSLERYLAEGLNVFGREATTKDWQETFNDLFIDAIKEAPGSAAYHSVINNKPLDEVLLTLSEKLAVFRNSLKAKNLAEKWASKINIQER